MALSLDDDLDDGDALSGGSSMSTSSLRALVRNLQHDSCEEVLNCLQRAEQRAAADGARARTRDELRALMERRVTFSCIFPVMFTSLLLKHTSEAERNTSSLSSSRRAEEDDDVQRVLDFTGGYELCGLLRSCVPALCQQLIGRFVGQRNSDDDEQAEVEAQFQTEQLDEETAGSGHDEEMKNVAELDVHRQASEEGKEEIEEQYEDEQKEGGWERWQRAGSAEYGVQAQLDVVESMRPHSPHPTLDLLDRASQRLHSAFPYFSSDSLLRKLCANIAMFTLEHLDVTEASREVYERIRLASRAYGKHMYSPQWSADTKNVLETVQKQCKAQQEQWEERLVQAAADYQQLHIKPELLVAQRSALRQWTELASQLTLAQLDPKKNGLARPVELRRVLLGHFSELSSLHASDLHSRLADTWEELFGEMKVGIFEQALHHMFPTVCHTREFQRAMGRVGDFALREPLLREWDDYMACNDERSLHKKADQGISQHRLLTLMQQLGKAQLQNWLESNWPTWKKRFIRERKRVLEDVRAGLLQLLDGVVEQFGRVVQQRVRLTVRHFMQNSFWWRRKRKGLRRPCLLDDAIKHFLREAHSYDRDSSDEQLRNSVRELLHELKQWERRARGVVQAIDKFDPAVLGRELVSSVQRNVRYSTWVLSQKMSEEVVRLIKAAQNRPQPHNPHSKLVAGPVAREGALSMLAQWQQQQQSCPPSPTLSVRIRQLNEQLRRWKQKLAVHDELSFGPGTSAEATSYTVDHMLRSVAIGLMTGGEADSFDDHTERHVLELVGTLKSIVALKLEKRADSSSVGAAVLEHYKCTSEEHHARLERGDAVYCPIILQLLASQLRVNFAVWTADSATKDGKLRVLSHQTQPADKTDKDKAVVAQRYVHLAFLPQCVADAAHSAATTLPYCVMPLFVAYGRAVSYSEVDEVAHYALEERSRPLLSTRAYQQSQRGKKRRPTEQSRVQSPTSPSSRHSAQYPVSPHSTQSYDHQQQIRGAHGYASLRSASASRADASTSQPHSPHHAGRSTAASSGSSQPNLKRVKL